MLKFNLPDKQYVLSLDNLDLSLLSQFIEKPPDEKKFLWSKSYIDGESTLQHCEIKILREEIHDHSYIEPSETYMCHICNIDVPQIYFKQHTQSRRHNSCKKLIEKVLEMSSSKINIDIDHVEIDIHSDHFYCETCSKVVLEKNKGDHITSKFHLKSLEYQKVTDKFLQIFVDKKEIETVFKDNEIECNKSHNIDEDIDQFSVCGSDTKHTEIDKDILCNDTACDYPKSPNLTDSSESESEKANMTENAAPSKPPTRHLDIYDENNKYQQYFKEMIEKYELQCKMPIVQGKVVVIETSKGFIELVGIDCFHGYKYNSRKFMSKCILCKEWIYKGSIHINTENHVKNILQPVNDSFVRQMSEECTVSHCLLCNELINSPDHETYHPNHEKYQREKGETSEDTFCNVCGTYVPTCELLRHNKNWKHEKLKRKKNNQAQLALRQITAEITIMNDLKKARTRKILEKLIASNSEVIDIALI